MQLADYLKSNGIKRNVFAASIGVSPQTVTGWCDGSFWISKDKAKRVLEATAGAVTPNDFLLVEPNEAAE